MVLTEWGVSRTCPWRSRALIELNSELIPIYSKRLRQFFHERHEEPTCGRPSRSDPETGLYLPAVLALLVNK